MRIAFIGLGRMGSELVNHVIDAGHEVTVWNRDPAKARPIAARGAKAADTAAQAVDGAELVLTTLFGPETVREVVLHGELPFGEGSVWVDITTVAPADTKEFAAWARTCGVTYVHSPVIGSLGPARERALGVLLGGPRHGVEKAKPVVSLWADPDRLRVVDTPAKAAAGKLVANLALATAMQGVAEAIRLGSGGGLSPDEVLEQLADKTPLATIAGLKGDLVRSGDFGEAQFSANALAKDAGLMVSTATGPLPALTAAYAALETAKAGGRGEQDFAVIADPGQ
jgi:3-hydroxyisobutyrate dehydrogenase